MKGNKSRMWLAALLTICMVFGMAGTAFAGTVVPETLPEYDDVKDVVVEAGVAGVDMQGYTFHVPSIEGFCGEDKYSFTKGNPREVVTDEVIVSKQCEFIEKVHGKGAEVLLSCHPGIAMNSTQVVELALFLEKRNPDIIKIVTSASNEDEMVESIKTMLLLKKEVKTPVSYHANGKFGGLTRIINPALGGQIAFCVDRFSESSTLEQLDLKTTKVVIDNLQKFI